MQCHRFCAELTETYGCVELCAAALKLSLNLSVSPTGPYLQFWLAGALMWALGLPGEIDPLQHKWNSATTG